MAITAAALKTINIMIIWEQVFPCPNLLTTGHTTDKNTMPTYSSKLDGQGCEHSYTLDTQIALYERGSSTPKEFLNEVI